MKLSEEILAVTNGDEESIPLGDFVDAVEAKGFGLLLVILSLPSALPVPAAGYSVPFGLVLWVLGLQMILGRSKPVLPRKLRSWKFSSSLIEKVITKAAPILNQLERIVRPRMSWIGSRGGRSGMGFLVIFMATLMMIPIPMTNTAPAFVIFLIGIGLSEEDGLLALGACVVGAFAAALYASLIVAMIWIGPEVVDSIKNWIRELV